MARKENPRKEKDLASDRTDWQRHWEYKLRVTMVEMGEDRDIYQGKRARELLASCNNEGKAMVDGREQQVHQVWYEPYQSVSHGMGQCDKEGRWQTINIGQHQERLSGAEYIRLGSPKKLQARLVVYLPGKHSEHQGTEQPSRYT